MEVFMSMKEDETYEYQIMQYRNQLDELDHIIINALRIRFEITDEIGVLKRKFDKPIYDIKREQEIVEKLKAMCSIDLSEIIEIKSSLGKKIFGSKAYSEANSVDTLVEKSNEDLIDNLLEVYKIIMEQSRKRQSDK